MGEIFVLCFHGCFLSISNPTMAIAMIMAIVYLLNGKMIIAI
jgi:hypothetical protein